MLCWNKLRFICAPFGFQYSNRLLTKRQLSSKRVCYTTQGSPLTFCKENTSRHNITHLKGLTYKNSDYSGRTFCTVLVKDSCWKCKQPIEGMPTFFCMSCKAVQPADEQASYFQIMDCDQVFTLDVQKLQKRYLQLQRSLHPDNFSQRDMKEQEYSENQSALVNRAYRTLLKPLSRGLYMLELKGMHIREGTDPGADPQFLMEVMEINEALDETQTIEETSEIGQSIKVRLQELTEQIDATLQKGELQAAKELLSQMKYFANIEEKVKEKLSELM